ncbi:protein kinase domain-containing protein [Streptomyces cucumeris]|uniref:serine/threonine-protein kinase n=1 Tax=Streptomyces cucumeris TaxID=2962890 RepID=UPI003D74C1CF
MQGVLLADRFRIGERLGVGGMGEVWSAQDERMRRDVAVKLVHSLPLGEEGETQARFQREVRLAGRLSHPNIVTVHDWGEEPISGRRTLYFVMELVRGVSLRQRLKESTPPWPVAVGWARQIAQALHAAHSRDVIHRDIKPANVLLTPEGAVKVLDFGVAKFLGDTMSIHELTVTGALVGSPPYMSPEQAEGLREIDHRSDLYSLGCLLYHVLTGRPPFTGTSPLAVLRMQAEAEPVPPAELVEGLPRSLDELTLSLLAKRPEDRPEDAAAVHAALSTLLVDHVVTLPEQNPLDIVQLGYTDTLSARLLERAWQIWRSTETYSATLRAEADHETERAGAQSEELLASARGRVVEAETEALRLLDEAKRRADEIVGTAERESRQLREAAEASQKQNGEAWQEAVQRIEQAAKSSAKPAQATADTNTARLRTQAEIDELRELAAKEIAKSLRSAGDRTDALVRAAEEELAEAQAKAKMVVRAAETEAASVRIKAVRKAETLLKEAEDKRSAALREAAELRIAAQREAELTIDQGRRELQLVLRRREDINAEISRVQDVLEALESFEPPGSPRRRDVRRDEGGV